jgi:hypothetical protein
MSVTEADLHPHLIARMAQRGVTLMEINAVLQNGWACDDARPGTNCRVLVFTHEQTWEGRIYAEKEVTVYFKLIDDALIVITVKARYGSDFPRRRNGR